MDRIRHCFCLKGKCECFDATRKQSPIQSKEFFVLWSVFNFSRAELNLNMPKAVCYLLHLNRSIGNKTTTEMLSHCLRLRTFLILFILYYNCFACWTKNYQTQLNISFVFCENIHCMKNLQTQTKNENPIYWNSIESSKLTSMVTFFNKNTKEYVFLFMILLVYLQKEMSSIWDSLIHFNSLCVSLKL